MSVGMPGASQVASAPRASLYLGVGAVVQILSGVALAKVLALYTGIDGVGLQGLCLTIGSLAALAGGLGVGSALVRALGGEGPEVRSRLSTATMTWFRLMGLATGILLFGLLLTVGMQGLGLGPLPLAQGVPLCVGMIFALLQVGDLAVLTAHRASTAIAVSTAVGSILGAAIGSVLIVEFGYSAITMAYVTTQASASLAAYVARRRIVGALPFRPFAAAADVRVLIGHGIGIAMSTVVGSGVQLIMPLLIQPISGLGSVGLFRAVTAITVGAVGILGIALSRDYYPRVAAASSEDLLDLPRQQQRLLLAASVPLVIVGTAFAGPILRIVYAPAFAAASTFFGLQLVGDVLRLTSFTYAYILLARAGRGTYLALEAGAGTLLITLGMAGLKLFGLNGLGAAYLISYTVYLVATAEFCRRRFGVRPTLGMVVVLGTICAAGLLLLGGWPPLVKLAIVAMATGGSGVLLLRSRPGSGHAHIRRGTS